MTGPGTPMPDAREKLTKRLVRVLVACDGEGKALFGAGDPPLWLVRKAVKLGLVDEIRSRSAAFLRFRTNDAGRRALEADHG